MGAREPVSGGHSPGVGLSRAQGNVVKATARLVTWLLDYRESYTPLSDKIRA